MKIDWRILPGLRHEMCHQLAAKMLPSVIGGHNDIFDRCLGAGGRVEEAEGGTTDDTLFVGQHKEMAVGVVDGGMQIGFGEDTSARQLLHEL